MLLLRAHDRDWESPPNGRGLGKSTLGMMGQGVVREGQCDSLEHTRVELIDILTY